MASLKSNFTAIFFLITVVSATITTSPPSKKCKSNQDCKQVKCSGAERLFPICGAGDVCTCFESVYERPCDTTDDCLSQYNITCSVSTSYCSCIENHHPKNNAKYDSNSNNYLSNEMMERKGGIPSEIRNAKCDEIVSCEFMCVRYPDMFIEYRITGGCLCKEQFA